MDTIDEFAGSYEISNPSSSSFFTAAASASTEPSIVNPPAAELLNKVDVSALQLLSNNLESVFDSPESLYSDAKLVLSDGREVSFHRFVLSARSPFFKNALAAAAADHNSAVKLKLKEIAKDYEVGFDSVVTVLAYVYSSRVRPPPKGVSECADVNCCHVACWPAVDFMLEVLYLAVVFKIPELVTLYQRHLLDVVDKVVIEDTLVILKLANICGEACKKLLDRCRDIIAKSDVDIVSLDKSLPEHIVKQIVEIRKKFGLEAPEVEKHVSNIHRALESDDVQLVKLLLTEGHTNLDDAYALHFAVAYCDVKTAADLLDLELADVNHRNPRGYTVLHVAAMRKEPQLIVSLLEKGANASEISLDGRTALLIAKQVTKAVVYNNVAELYKHSHKDRLCVEILEQADKRVPVPRDAPPSLEVADDELKMRLCIEIQEQAEKGDPIPRDVPPSLDVAADEQKMTLCIEIQEQAEKGDPIPRDVPPSLEVADDELKMRLCIEIQEQAEKGDPIPRDVPPSLDVAADEQKMTLCIEIQEQAEKGDPIPRDVPPSLEVAADELKLRLFDLENRVAFAQRLFPMEAQVAMDMAQMKGTCEFTGSSLEPEGLTGEKRTALDVNIEPFKILEGHKSRLKALSRTVELGKRFFPRCSGVLDKIFESDDLAQLPFGEEDTPDNRVQKRQRYMEIQETLKKAFSQDKRNLESKSRCSTVMAFLVVINLVLEIASAVADQLSSIHKPYFTRISLVMSILSVVLSIIDLSYKIRYYKARFRCKWPIPWFYYPSRGYNRIFGSFTDLVLLFCVVGGLIVSTINYSFIERRRDGPIKVSIWPLFFAIGMAASKFMEKPTISKGHLL